MSGLGDFSNGRKEFLERLRGEWPDGTRFVCGYPGEGPPGYDRIFDPHGTVYADVPQDSVRERYSVPPGERGGEVGTVLIVEPDLDIEVSRTKPADLLVGPILPRLVRLGHVTKCYVFWTRTPRHNPVTGWLDSE
jgi:hypothetical protein